MKKVLVAMSGGVDSSAAALLLRQAGWDCVGATMKLLDGAQVRPGSRVCCSLDDIEDARAAAWRIGIPHHVFNLTEDFDACVASPFVSSYLRGETPNPCVECNRRLKFDRFYRRAMALGFDAVATGHYARVLPDPDTGALRLLAARDKTKDQSYVLWSLTQEQLAHTLFPLGELTKGEVRALSARFGLQNAQKPDSEDLCFVPGGDYAAFLERRTGAPLPPGDFLDREGRVLGRHRGLARYTVGQRRGVGISGPEPRYVLSKDPAANTVTLGPESALFSSRFSVREVSWVSGVSPASPLRAEVCVRYQGKRTPALLTPLPGGRLLAETDLPVRAVTPGQSAVFYRGGEVLGGGIITR